MNDTVLSLDARDIPIGTITTRHHRSAIHLQPHEISEWERIERRLPKGDIESPYAIEGYIMGSAIISTLKKCEGNFSASCLSKRTDSDNKIRLAQTVDIMRFNGSSWELVAADFSLAAPLDEDWRPSRPQ
jgi:hypothetical protein